MTCTCTTFDPNDTGVRQCPEHFKLWRGAVRLTSVSRIVGASFPLPPGIPPDVLESARERGEQVDKLFASYVLGKLKAFPVGTREDSRRLFDKAADWYDKQSFKRVEVQVLLGCEDYGGVLDFRFDGVPLDLKATYNVEQSARMQVAAYTVLDPVNNKNHDVLRKPGDHQAFILHVTDRFKEARVIPLAQEDFADWSTILAHWRMLQRRGRKESGDENS